MRGPADYVERAYPIPTVATAVLDDRGTVLRWSRAAADLLDRTAEEVCGRPVRALLTDGSGAGTDDTGVPAEGRTFLRHRDGRPVDVTLRVQRLEPAAELLLFFVPTEHATAWKHGEGALRALLEQDRIGVTLYGPDLTVVRSNTGPRAFGGAAASPAGRPADPLAPQDAVASATGEWPSALLQPGRAVPPVLNTAGLWNVQHGRAAVLDRAAVLALFREPGWRRTAVPEHGHSAMRVPVLARGLVLGTVAVWRTDRPDPFDAEDADLLTEIASRAALSVDNARRYTREHRSVLALQQRLLPDPTTDTPAAETAGLYLPTGSGAGISGDWYDVIPLPSFRVALVVGDVTGHGLYATATMGRLCTAVRTLADLELDPTELLTHLDDRVQQLTREADPASPVVATCLYVVCDPVARRCAVAGAGHPPPVLVRPDGTTEVIGVAPGAPLGVGDMPFETVTVDLEPGSVLALYTDGLVEHRADDADADGGWRWLRESLAAACGSGRPLDASGRALLAELDGAPPRDDIALLLARTRAVPADHTVCWEFDAEPTAVATARQAVTRQLADWGLEDVAFTTELIVSELITNAVRYAGGPVGLRLIRENALVCEVTDPSNTQPRLRRARWTDEGGRGLFLVAQLSSRWGCRYGGHGKTIWAEQPFVPTEADLTAFL
ncbi:SpoIIE family protein phosphatase [Streptomyces sp. MMCC 100]|uniref:ATP-binding SpoIIE family protein phosphatase n=1 Tax=Streptomyces sp. MMCC 100 TaxID=3163555 RepID=UPI003596B6C4